MLRILQVGAGPSGASFLRQLTRRLGNSMSKVEYTVVDEMLSGGGAAFRTPCNTHILNLPASSMSLDPNNADEFLEWRETYKTIWQENIDSNEEVWSEYPPRKLYGIYVQYVLNETIRSFRNIRLCRDKVVNIVPMGSDNYIVEFSENKTAIFDLVILCIGSVPIKPLFDESVNGFIASPYSEFSVPDNANVGIIGTRLSAIDTALKLKETGHRGKITMASKSGKLPSVIGPPYHYTYKDFKEALAETVNSPSLVEVFNVFKHEVNNHCFESFSWDSISKPGPTSLGDLSGELTIVESGKVRPWQSILMSSYLTSEEIWRNLPYSERAYFLKNYANIWMRYLAAFPPASAKRIMNLISTGQLFIKDGLEYVGVDSSGFNFSYTDRPPDRFDYVIDARGLGYDEESLTRIPLIRNMLKSNLIATDELCGLRVDPESFRSLSKENLDIYILGDLTKGAFLATTDVARNLDQADRLSLVISSLVKKISKLDFSS